MGEEEYRGEGSRGEKGRIRGRGWGEQERTMGELGRTGEERRSEERI